MSASKFFTSIFNDKRTFVVKYISDNRILATAKRALINQPHTYAHAVKIVFPDMI